jgi:D-alanyl-D-alanine carboxypeptidase
LVWEQSVDELIAGKDFTDWLRNCMVMKRRDFLKALTAGVLLSGIDPFSFVSAAQLFPVPQRLSRPDFDGHIKDYLHKMENFDHPHSNDVILEDKQLAVLNACVSRLKRLQGMAGHGNFNILGFDDGLSIARRYSEVGDFTKEELEFLEMIFYSDSAVYGFWGEKPIDNITTDIKNKDVMNVSESGNYLYKGTPHEMYETLRKRVGDQLYLTSGVRGVLKQFLLFLDKANDNMGNLSLASRSLAPPGYSYHGVADFDVGQKGYGVLNFTGKFTTTEVFKKLEDLEYVTIRYPKNNLMGVRFEPWHIKVYPEA